MATKKENISLKRKLNDSFEEITETDEELTSLTQKYKTNVAILGNIEQNYGNVLNKLTKDSFDKDSLNKNLKLELSELQERYINTSEELEKAEEKIQKLKTKNLTKKLKQEINTLKNFKRTIKLSSLKVENELSKSKLDLKEMEREVGKLKKEKQLQHKFELLNYMQLHISI